MEEKVKKVEKVPDSTVVKDIIELSQTTGNIYESTVYNCKESKSDCG